MKDIFLKLIRKYSNDEKYNLECWNEIEDNYLSKHRYYHNLEHLENMFFDLDKVKSQIKDLDTLLFAIYYHDIIYKPSKSDNEYQSALIFKKRISKTSFSKINKCIAEIEATKDHKLSNDSDTNILLDLDLSILGKSINEYNKYTIKIRKEYQIYPNFIYRKGRKKVLQSILDKGFIYKTEFFIKEYENQAQENIKFELKQLK